MRSACGVVLIPPPYAVAGADDVLAMLVPISIRRSHARYMADVDKLLRNETEAINAAMSSGQKCVGVMQRREYRAISMY